GDDAPDLLLVRGGERGDPFDWTRRPDEPRAARALLLEQLRPEVAALEAVVFGAPLDDARHAGERNRPHVHLEVRMRDARAPRLQEIHPGQMMDEGGVLRPRPADQLGASPDRVPQRP